MKLIRLDSNPNPKSDEFPDNHIEQSYRFEMVDDGFGPDDAAGRISFPRFGRGDQRRSDFAVEVDWLDVKMLVREYVRIGHAEALYVKRLIGLAEAVERAGWPPNDPPMIDFDSILPSD